jgi:hypothetical protein
MVDVLETVPKKDEKTSVKLHHKGKLMDAYLHAY